MNIKLVLIRVGIIALVVSLVKWTYNKLENDPGMLLVYFLCMGMIGGLLVVKFVLPWFGDAVSTALLSSGEEVKLDDGMKAAAKLAKGDYLGAIADHEKALRENSARSFSVAEIAKIHAEKLNDPQTALQVLQQHLAAREWPADDDAFLRFRVIDIHINQLADYNGARARLEKVIVDFPNTRHAANAYHKMGEVEQAQYKQITERRQGVSGGQA